MLRENNSSCNYLRFIAGRESSMADKSIRGDSNLALACTSPANVSDPQGYNYQYAITMARNTGYKVAAIARGNGTMTVSSQLVYEEGGASFSGEGTLIADMHTAEAMEATMQGEGSMSADGLTLEVDTATFDAGSRPSALDIQQEVLSGIIESGVNLRDALKILIAVAAGKTTITDHGGGSATVIFRDTNDLYNRLEADMSDSERVNITIDKT